MFRTLTVAVLVLGMAGCGGGNDDAPTAVAETSTAAASSNVSPESVADDREAKLLVATQSYVDALLAGKLAGVLGYLDPKVCDAADESSYALGIHQIKDVAEGATMKILSVKLYDDGSRGGTGKFELSDGAPDSLRRLIKSSMDESK